MPIIDIKALPVDPSVPSRCGDVEGGTMKRGVERTALEAESEPPKEWTEVSVIFLLLFIIPEFLSVRLAAWKNFTSILLNRLPR